MNSFKALACILIFLALATDAMAETPRFTDGHDNVFHSVDLATSVAGPQLIGPAAACPGDFEAGWGPWTSIDLSLPPIGNYAHRLNLLGAPTAKTNFSWQAVFVADGVTGPTCPGITWTYGSGGFVVENDGGVAGPSAHLHNVIRSPVLAWPICVPECTGAKLDFEVFRHEELTADSPGMFYTWGVRSTANTVGFTTEPFLNRNLVYYGAPSYINGGDANVGDLLVPGRKWVQIEVGVYELGYLWGWDGSEGTPAPYFDNITLEPFSHIGPSMTAREMDLAQDAFPTTGMIHTGGDMGLNSVRFDMAANISPSDHLRNDPGDSIVVDVFPVRAGAVLTGNPTMHYLLMPNPIFDSYRITGLPNQGSVVGQPAVGISGTPTPGKWAFDLPDTGFFFPGDVLHYYIRGEDTFGSGTLPANITTFGTPLYNPSFVVRALPTMLNAAGDQPGILFWNDFANRGGLTKWHTGFAMLGHRPGIEYDTYYTNAPSSGLGNGLGGRATSLQLDGYDTIAYTCGDLSALTIANGDFELDAGDDVGVLTDWLATTGKYLFATGDNLASDLDQSGFATETLLADNFGLTWNARHLRDSRGESLNPIVLRTGTTLWPGTAPPAWVVLGSTSPINKFDDVGLLATTATQEAATLLKGAPGATLNTYGGSKVVYMPYDWSFILGPPPILPKADKLASLPIRVELLDGILADAGHPRNVDLATDVPEGTTAFAAKAYPNPFNPVTRIEYMMPRAGNLSVKVYSVRGELVRSLIDEFKDAGPGHIIWDGTSDQGRDVSSGVYFCEVRTGGEVKIQKMALLK